MPAEHNPGSDARKPGGNYRRPIIAAMPRVNYLNPLRTDESRRVQNERNFQRTDRQRMKRNSKLLCDFRKLAPRRTCQPNRVAKL
jgi:hypothetical protein